MSPELVGQLFGVVRPALGVAVDVAEVPLPRVQVGVRRGHDELQVVAGQPFVVHARHLLPGRGDRHPARNRPHDPAGHRAVGRRGRVVDDTGRGFGDDAIDMTDAGGQVERRGQCIGGLADALFEP